MLMTLSGMVTLVRLVQPLKAYSPMVATLVGDRYAYQATAAAEGPQPNVGNAVGDRHAHQTTAAIEGNLHNYT